MLCPECNGDTKVFESRVVAGKVVRRRVCKVCKYPFITIEDRIDYNKGLDLLTIGRRKARRDRKSVV